MTPTVDRRRAPFAGHLSESHRLDLLKGVVVPPGQPGNWLLRPGRQILRMEILATQRFAAQASRARLHAPENSASNAIMPQYSHRPPNRPPSKPPARAQNIILPAPNPKHQRGLRFRTANQPHSSVRTLTRSASEGCDSAPQANQPSAPVQPLRPNQTPASAPSPEAPARDATPHAG